MTSYDSSIIEAMADGLYAQARRLVILYTVGFAVVGAPLGAMAAGAADKDLVYAGLAVGALLAGFGGFTVGRSKAFVLKLQAQTALCQVQIERNTRQVGRPADRGDSPRTEHAADAATNPGGKTPSRLDALMSQAPPK